MIALRLASLSFWILGTITALDLPVIRADTVLPIYSPYAACQQRQFYQPVPISPDLGGIQLPDNDCHIPKEDILSRTGLLSGFESLDRWNQAGDLAITAGKRYQAYLDGARHETERMQACVGRLKSWNDATSVAQSTPSCADVIELFQKKILPAYRQARKHLARATEPELPKSAEEKFPRERKVMPLPFLPDRRKRQPLSESETADFLKEIQADLARIKSEFENAREKAVAGMPDGPKKREMAKWNETFKNTPVLESFNKDWPEWRSYRDTRIGELKRTSASYFIRLADRYPVIRLLTAADPTPAECVAAMQETVISNQEKRNLIQAQIGQIESSAADSLDAIFELTSYPLVMESVLKANPKLCGIAIEVALRRDDQAIRQALAMGVPMVLAGFLLPPSWGVALTLGATGYAAYDSQVAYERLLSESETSPVVNGKAAPVNTSNAAIAGFDLATQVASLPLTVAGIPVLRKIPTPNVRSFK